MSDLISSFLGIFSLGVDRAAAKANNMLSQVNAESNTKVRTARNAAEASKNNLARWMQSVNNNRVLDQGGKNLEQSVVNYRRQSDATLLQDFSTSVQQAEQAGAAHAAQAFSGVGGSVVDMVNGATALRDSLVTQHIEDIRGTQAYDQGRRAGSIMSQTTAGLDNSIIMDTFDYNKDVVQKQVVPSYASAYLNFGLEAAKTAASFYMGPATGAAKKPGAPTGWDSSSANKFSFKLDNRSLNIGDYSNASDQFGSLGTGTYEINQNNSFFSY